jgi:hypothetical protein
MSYEIFRRWSVMMFEILKWDSIQKDVNRVWGDGELLMSPELFGMI